MARGGNDSKDFLPLHPDQYLEAKRRLQEAWQAHLDFSRRHGIGTKPRSLTEIDRDLELRREDIAKLENERQYAAAWGNGKLEILERQIDDQIRAAQQECDELGL
jgi:hypothetical protein